MTENSAIFGGHSAEEYEQLLKTKLQPSAIRSTLSFAGLYQMTHEMLKHAILEMVRNFYCIGFDERGAILDTDEYQKKVIETALDEGWIKERGQKFNASAAWLVRSGAITAQQAIRLQAIYEHRHELTHNLMSFIVDPNQNLDAQMFVDAVATLRDVHRFWTSIEKDMGTFDHLDNVALEDVTPLSLMLLQQCIDAYIENP